MKNYLIARTSSVFLLTFITVFSGSWVVAGESGEPPRKWFSSQIQGYPQGELAKPKENLSSFTSNLINPTGRSFDNSGSASSDQAGEDQLYFAQAQEKPPTEPEKGGMTMEEIGFQMKSGVGVKLGLEFQPLFEGILDQIRHIGHIHFLENVGGQKSRRIAF